MYMYVCEEMRIVYVLELISLVSFLLVSTYMVREREREMAN